MSEPDFSIDWTTLHREIFAAICGDPALLARYNTANSGEAQEICSEVLDRLVCDAGDFLERFIVRNAR